MCTECTHPKLIYKLGAKQRVADRASTEWVVSGGGMWWRPLKLVGEKSVVDDLKKSTLVGLFGMHILIVVAVCRFFWKK